MTNETKGAEKSGVDKGLVSMFLRMSPEERLRANDNAFRTILELRDAYRRQKTNERKPSLDHKLIEPKERELSGKGHVLLTTRLGPLDVLAVIEGGRSYKDLLDHIVKIDFRGSILRVLDLKMLIEFKKTSRDPKDKQRLPVLKETLRQLKRNMGTRRTKKIAATNNMAVQLLSPNETTHE